MTNPLIADAVAHADLIHGRPELNAAIIEMGAKIDAALNGEVPVFLSIMHGGLIFAGALALCISTDLYFDYVHATRYRNAPEEINTSTDKNGKFTVTWPHAGMYWINASAQDQHTQIKQAKQRRVSYSATLEVLPE